jgi:hypothetical protein
MAPYMTATSLSVRLLIAALFALPLAAYSAPLALGVRGLATRAPKNMKIDGDLSEFQRGSKESRGPVLLHVG